MHSPPHLFILAKLTMSKYILIIVYTLEKSLPSSWWHGIFFEFARLKLVLLKGHIRREMFSEKILKFDAGNKKLQWFMPPSLSKCWARCNIFMSRQTIEQNPNQIRTWSCSSCSTYFKWRRHESPKLLMACPKHKKNYINELTSDVAFQQY